MAIMRIVVLGGTRFIGRAIVEELVRAGHDVVVVHRGETEPSDLVEVEHVHVERGNLASVQSRLEGDTVVDCLAMTRASAEAAVAALPSGAHLVVLSSADVYASYGSLMAGTVTEAVPSHEGSPVRSERYPYRGQMPGMDDYEKLDVEEVYLGAGGTVLRLPMVYGPHDGQRREWFVLRRVVAGRRRIPIGAGTWLSSRGFVADIAACVRLAVESDAAAGEVFNVAERRTSSMRLWAEQILAAAGSDAELVTVADDVLPEDLGMTGTIPQHLVIDSAKARAVLGWGESDPSVALRQSVEWHLAHPPADDGRDFSADDKALA